MTLTRARPLRRPANAAVVLGRNELAIVAGLVALAAALRFPTLATQSFWHDEAVTVGRVLQPNLGNTLHMDFASEATPPTYYVLAWIWTRAFGVSEFAVRSLSALCGVALVPVVYAAARRLLWPSAAVVAAALVAVSPFFVWYSQEARAYALLALLSGLSVLCFARALELPTGRRLAAWAGVSALALTTHYFAAFLVVPEAAWLLGAAAAPPRRKVAAVAPVAAVGAALVPLALHQGAVHPDNWIARIPPGTRLAGAAKAFVAAPSGSPSPVLYVAGGVALLVALVLLAGWGSRGERRLMAVPLALAGASLGVPLLLMAAGVDYFYPRNLIPAFVVALIVLAAGLSVTGAGRVGVAAAAALCVVNLVAVIAVNADPALQRADWRGAARAIGPARTQRALVVPFIGDDPIALYLPGTKRARGTTTASEVDVLGFREGGGRQAQAPAPGFREFDQRRFGHFVLVRFRGPRRPLRRIDLARAKIGQEHGAVMVQPAAGR